MAAFEAYEAATQSTDPGALLVLADSLEMGMEPGLHALARLSRAYHAYRTDRLKEGMDRLTPMLDSCEAGDQQLCARGFKLQAMILKRSLALEQALVAIDKGMDLLTGHPVGSLEADMRVVRAEIERRMGRYDEASADLQTAEKVALRLGVQRTLGNILINQGNLYYSQERYEKAWSTYRKCLDLAVAARLYLLADHAAMNLGSAAHMMDRYSDALALYDSLLSATQGIDRSLRPLLLANAGLALAAMGRHQEAIEHYKEAFSGASPHDDDRNIKVLQHLAASQWELGQRDKAIGTLQHALDMVSRTGWREVEAEVRYTLFLWYRTLGVNDAALTELERYSDLDDSLDQVRFGERISRLEIQYDTEKKEKRLELTAAELSSTRARARARTIQRDALIGFSILALFVLLLIWRAARQQRRLRVQEKRLHDQRVDELLKGQELRVLNAAVQAQQEERERIAKDLHDHLGSMLSAIKLQFSAMDDRIAGLAADQRKQYDHLFDLLDKAVTEVRRISHDMARGTIAIFGLRSALHDLAEIVAVPGRLEVELNTFGLEERLAANVELATYRMAQELVSNALKHGGATELSIDVTRGPGRLSLIVSDNGRGFDPRTATQGLGLANVRSRAAELQGTVQVDTSLGRGTTVSVEVPLV
ncbi:MAG: tetratricopeptide repeat protein [Flavobacteriales bacterium]|nr:tetratricopeptide repeat protein [Flavobacteriales bacterium]MCB9166401.1 tetratricopeptide repeat protein [Flavobacteriales bacterium]